MGKKVYIITLEECPCPLCDGACKDPQIAIYFERKNGLYSERGVPEGDYFISEIKSWSYDDKIYQDKDLANEQVDKLLIQLGR